MDNVLTHDFKRSENLTRREALSDEMERNMFSDYPDALTVKEVSHALRIGMNNTYRLIQEGKIKHFIVGRKYLIPRKYLIDFVLNGCYNGTTV